MTAIRTISVTLLLCYVVATATILYVLMYRDVQHDWPKNRYSDSRVASPLFLNFGKVFVINEPDFRKSPLTGMTRRHWIDAAVYLLQGAFIYVDHLSDSMNFPKQTGKSYPTNSSQKPIARLEAMVRTLFVACPLLKENPHLVMRGIPVAKYYRNQILKLIDPTSDLYVHPRTSNESPSQILVEFGGLSLVMFTIPEILWDPLTAEQQHLLMKTMLSYGEGPTLNSNWRFFNILVLSFFKSRGYAVNENLLDLHIKDTLHDYVGGGWYADEGRFDYYSMWAFQLYGVLWSQYFGFKYYPSYAARFMANFDQLKDNYPHMFSRNGEMIMWGRSISYRFASVSPLPFTAYRNDSRTNYGWLRRIASGTLLQFLQHPKYLQDNVPTLGFFGAFEPSVQGYNCRGSAYWAGKAFLGLLLPETNPYWSSIENEGPWTKMGRVSNKFEVNSKILITNYPAVGGSEIRSLMCDLQQSYLGGTIYNRLAYHSAFPWQEDGSEGEVSMNYVVRSYDNDRWHPIRCYNFNSYQNGIYNRDAKLTLVDEFHFKLTDVILENGVLRIDSVEGCEAADVHLGHYALPQLETPITQSTRQTPAGNLMYIIANGKYSLAMGALYGWQDTETVFSEGLNPAARNSGTIMVTDRFEPGNGCGIKIYVTLMLWKAANKPWTIAELEPVKSVAIELDFAVVVALSNGTTLRIPKL